MFTAWSLEVIGIQNMEPIRDTIRDFIKEIKPFYLNIFESISTNW